MSAPVEKARPVGLSVVIPTLDRLDLVERAIASVQCATPERVEIIVVDDGSRVDLRPRLPARNACGIAVRSYRFERNRGPQAARNLGIRRARYSHIAFLDSDDAFTPDKLDRVLHELAQGEIDVLFHGVAGMPRYARLARWWQRQSTWLPFHWWVPLLNPVVTPALVVRRQCRLGVPTMRHCEDWAFLLNYVSPHTRVRYVDADLASVFRAPGSEGGLSGAVWRMRAGEFRARRVLMRKPGAGPVLRLALGSVAGTLRVFNDLLRGRYF